MKRKREHVKYDFIFTSIMLLASIGGLFVMSLIVEVFLRLVGAR